ncbi:hypothetical protein D3C75_351430 [compost metagenome]
MAVILGCICGILYMFSRKIKKVICARKGHKWKRKRRYLKCRRCGKRHAHYTAVQPDRKNNLR